MGIVVEKPGLLTTVQDEGRFGYQQFGVSPAGPMDNKSFHLANILVGNERGEGALEMTFTGPELLFEKENLIAVTGGNMAPSINGEKIQMYQTVLVHAGERLSFGTCTSGCRAYLAFAGGLDIPLVMGSKATLIRNQLGGYKGRKLAEGDSIGFVHPKSQIAFMERRKIAQEVFPEKEIILRVVAGPQDTEFSEEEVRRFFWYSAEITNEFDRMGCRLRREEPIRPLKDGNIISDGIMFGSIQVPTNGQPIIMLADRQSTGGYAKIGTVISTDLPKVAQSVPGYHIRFIRVGIQLAQQLYLRQRQELKNLEKQLGQKK